MCVYEGVRAWRCGVRVWEVWCACMGGLVCVYGRVGVRMHVGRSLDGLCVQLARLVKAYQKELATFTHGRLIEPDLLPGEKAVRGKGVVRCGGEREGNSAVWW